MNENNHKIIIEQQAKLEFIKNHPCMYFGKIFCSDCERCNDCDMEMGRIGHMNLFIHGYLVGIDSITK